MISVIIPVHGDANGLRTTLASLSAQLDGRDDVEVIVCNDGSGDAISAVAREYDCVEVALPRRSGSYAARNAGILASRGTSIAFLDADQQLEATWLTAGSDALVHADYVGGRVIVQAPRDAGLWLRYDQANAFPVEEYLKTMTFAPTANLFVRRSVLDAVGAFCPSLWSGGDWEFGTRVAAAGFRQAYCADAITYHQARGFSAQLAKIRRVATGAADVRFGIRNEPAGASLLSSAWIVARFPLQLVSQCARWYLFPARRAEPGLGFVLVRKAWSAMFNFWTVIGAIRYAILRISGRSPSSSTRGMASGEN